MVELTDTTFRIVVYFVVIGLGVANIWLLAAHFLTRKSKKSAESK